MKRKYSTMLIVEFSDKYMGVYYEIVSTFFVCLKIL